MINILNGKMKQDNIYKNLIRLLYRINKITRLMIIHLLIEILSNPYKYENDILKINDKLLISEKLHNKYNKNLEKNHHI